MEETNNLKIGSFLKNVKKEKSTITSERQLVIKDFLEKINPLRKKAGYKPYSAKMFASVKVAHISTKDLKDFYYKCEKSPNFTKCFEGSLKIDKGIDKKDKV